MERFRSLTPKDRMTGYTIVAVACGLLIGVAIWIGQDHPAWFAASAVAVLAALVVWHSKAFGYRCETCGTEFSATPLQDFLAPHYTGKKYLKCPGCGQKEWAKVIARGQQ